MAMAFGCYVDSASIEKDIDKGCAKIIPPEPNSRTNLIKLALLAAAGAGADVAFFRGVKDEIDGVLIGLESDQRQAQLPLCELGQEGMFFHYVTCSEAIFSQNPYREVTKEFAEELLRVGQISSQSILRIFAEKVPPIDTAVLEIIFRMQTSDSCTNAF